MYDVWNELGDSQSRVELVGMTAVIELKDADSGHAYAVVDDPEDMRRLAAQLVIASSTLQDRIDVENGEGGDQ